MLDLFGLFFALTVLTGLLLVGGLVMKAVFGLVLLPIKLGLWVVKLALSVVLTVIFVAVVLPLLLTLLPLALVFLAVPLVIASTLGCLWLS